MRNLINGRHFTGLCTAALLLQGCAAATVVRQPPDFDEENRQRLLQRLHAETVATAFTGQAVRSD